MPTPGGSFLYRIQMYGTNTSRGAAASPEAWNRTTLSQHLWSVAQRGDRRHGAVLKGRSNLSLS